MTTFIISSIIIAALVTLSGVFGQSSTSRPSSPAPQPSYQPQDNAGAYVPHATYPYSDTFGGAAYEGYLMPTTYPKTQSQGNALTTQPESYTQVTLKYLAKFGIFLIGAVAAIIVGGLLTTAICSLTSVCTITFSGFGGINKETVRSLMNPEHISAAAALVQDAVGKYQRLQRAVSS